MFDIVAQFEDCRIKAWSTEGKDYQFKVEDTMTDEISDTISITALQLSYIMQMNLDNDGMPESYEKMYESLEPLFKDWPNNLRPIP